MGFVWRCAVVLAAAALLLTSAVPASAKIKADHTGWPDINGGLFINKFDRTLTMDMRPGADPYDGMDPSFKCDGDHHNQQCFIDAGACERETRHRSPTCVDDPVMPAANGRHHELLGGHGDDTIYGGDSGDVIWGDYKYPPQPLTQHDVIYGGTGPDFIYASHGYNSIHTGGGADLVNARYGRGEIWCDSPDAVTNFSRRSRVKYVLHGCQHVTEQAIGTFDDGT